LLVVIELKTAIVDVNELIGTLDRKRRLGTQIAASRGWAAGSVSGWLIVADSSTNRRRVADHRTMLTSALPQDGRSLAPFFLHPERGPVSGISFWSDSRGVRVSHPIAAQQRVVRRRQTAGAQSSRVGAGSGAVSDR